MPNHPNRKGAKAPSANPSRKEVRAAREAAGLTQTAAAALVHTTCRNWQQWEAGDRRMHPGLWELFRIKSATLTALKYGLPRKKPLGEGIEDAVERVAALLARIEGES